MNLLPSSVEKQARTKLLQLFVVLIGLVSPSAALAQFDRPFPDIAAIKVPAAEEAPKKPGVDISNDLRPLMNVELGFIKRVCQPTSEQRVAIAAAAEKCIAAMSEIAVANQGGPGAELSDAKEVVAVTASGQQLTEHPLERLRRDMSAALRPLLSAEQYSVYRDEYQKRARFQRRLAVDVAVELLDQQLALTDPQRSTLTSHLLDQWHEAEYAPIASYLSNPFYIPELPEDVILSALDEQQTSIWRSLNKTYFPSYLSQFSSGVWEEDFLK